MVTLFRPDRPDNGFMAWYAERKQRCVEQIWKVAGAVLDTGSDVILELGLVQRLDRQAFYHRVDGTEHLLSVQVLEASEALRHERVRQRNEQQSGTFRMVVSDEMFAIANAAWQPPDDEECRARAIRIIDSHGPHPEGPDPG
jgi:predicted kinase